MHAYHGKASVEHAISNHWYDAVIPNYFDLADFTYNAKKMDYLLFLGRVNSGKGIHVAEQLAKATGRTLVVAGAGEHEFNSGADVKRVGVVGPEARRKLLSNAKAVICASTFLEPFCGVQIEAQLSGTPVISTDWGAFAEYNLHGVTGYRCKTFEQFTWAVRHLDDLSSAACRLHGEKFSIEKIGPRFTDYFQSAADTKNGGPGWYAERPDRKDLTDTSF
jgi:glycosyltransferase involved in cell wall biosynthesis